MRGLTVHIFCILSEFNESFSLLWRNVTHVECIYDFKPKVNTTAFIVHCTLEEVRKVNNTAAHKIFSLEKLLSNILLKLIKGINCVEIM